MTETNFIDIHILHPVPFSNLNRDNLGTPKSLTYGGVTRSRISSQCAKRAARLWLENNTDMDAAVRTRRLPETTRQQMKDSGFDDADAIAAVKTIFWSLGIAVEGGTDDAPLHGAQLTFTSRGVAERLADIAARHKQDILETAARLGLTEAPEAVGGEPASEDGEAAVPEAAKPAKKSEMKFDKRTLGKPPWSDIAAVFAGHNIVIALCGRMLADKPDTNVDGALQVAHAFTTHAVTVEQDYFTAVDDIAGDDKGAAHIGVNEFTSGVFYRHATIDLNSLRASLAQDRCQSGASTAAATAAAFVRAFALAEPTGKQNTANAHTRPALIAVTARSDRPVSHAAAFEAPVGSRSGGGHSAASVARLNEHAAADNALYGTDGLAAGWHAVRRGLADGPLDGLGEPVTALEGLVEAVEAHLRDEP